MKSENKRESDMNVLNYKNELILIFSFLCIELVASCWLLALYKKQNRELRETITLYRENTVLSKKEMVLYEKFRMRIEDTNKSLEKSFKESQRIKLGENESGNLILEFYDKDQNKKIFLFENGLIRE